MSETTPVVVQIVAAIFFPLLFVEGVALASGSEWAHRLGLELRSGTHTLERPVDSEVTLPQEDRGTNALWLRVDALAYWSSMLHLGFRWQGLPMPFFLRATGLLCSGTMELSVDGRELVWTERLRLWPPLFMLTLGLTAPVAFGIEPAGARLMAGALYCAFFLACWAGLSLVGLALLKTARLSLLRGVLSAE